MLNKPDDERIDIQETPSELTGRFLGGYEILERLGAGALAEVWLAKDNRLQRRVALKILRPKFAREADQLRRFEQEARAASKLSHPNIVTIFEIGESEGWHFIAQEFIEGVTLRERLKNGPLSLDSVADIAVQVASALAVAHRAGIIHRDIKPANLMIRPDGLVKVLDFGIARVKDPGSGGEQDWRQTADGLTVPGQILGTVKYMSPEQARGLPLDQRSDLFSLGAVLYEMATGQAPFTGETSVDTLVAVLTDEPPEPRTYRPEIANELEQAILQCLKKDREQRIASAEELASCIEGVQVSRVIAQHRPTHAVRIPARQWITISVLAAILALSLWRYGFHTGSSVPFDAIEMTRVTLPSTVTDAAISPDANNIAYILQGSTGPSLWVRQLAAAQDNRVAILEPGAYRNVLYSPDGAFVYYVQTTNAAATLYRVRLTNGEMERVLSGVTGRISLSPDSRRIAFVQRDTERLEESLSVANADGSGQRIVATRRRPYYFSPAGVAWASDLRAIFCLAGNQPFYNANAYHLARVDLDSGRETQIPDHTWARVGSLAASVDGRMLIVSGSERREEELQLWRVSYPSGLSTRITRDVSNYTKLSLSADARSLLAIRLETSADLWTSPAADPDEAKQISNGQIAGLNSAAWTTNGSIVYSAWRDHFLNVWKMDPATGGVSLLNRSDTDEAEVATTPDGRYILYQSGGKIWRMNADGTGATQLTHGNLDVHPVASHDSQWVLYASFQGWSPDVGGMQTIWKIPIGGGEPVQLIRDSTSIPVVSPDGKLIACSRYLLNEPQSTPGIGVYDFETGKTLKTFERPDGSDDKVYWTADGRWLDYIVMRAGVSNIWRQSFSGGEPRQITHFRAQQLFFLCPSFDGKRLVLGRGEQATQVVLIAQAPR